MFVLLIYRASRFFNKKGCRVCSNWCKRLCLILTGADISPASIIGKIKIAHTAGVVIGAGAVIEDGCQIYSGVVLGVSAFDKPRSGWKWQTPIIRRNCILGTGAKIIGPIEIGEGCILGANTVVTKDIPPYSVVVGLPGKVIGSTRERKVTK